MTDLISEVPAFGQAIGLEFVDVANREVVLRVPYQEHLVGDPDTGVIHGGVITAALDNGSGWAVRAISVELQENLAMATLDLRIDYMRPATPREDLIIYAECYKQTKNIAFVRASAHHGDVEDPVATSVATFMIGTPNTPRQ